MKTPAGNSIALIDKVRRLIDEFLQLQLDQAGLADLAPSHANILLTLFGHEAMTMSALSEAVGRDPSTVTALVKKLERLGHLRRRPAPEDSRCTQVALTGQGRKLRQPLQKISERLHESSFNGVHETDLLRLNATLEKIIANCRKNPENAGRVCKAKRAHAKTTLINR